MHNKNITSNEVLDAYKDWAQSYEPDLLALHPDSKWFERKNKYGVS